MAWLWPDLKSDEDVARMQGAQLQHFLMVEAGARDSELHDQDIAFLAAAVGCAAMQQLRMDCHQCLGCSQAGDNVCLATW